MSFHFIYIELLKFPNCYTIIKIPIIIKSPKNSKISFPKQFCPNSYYSSKINIFKPYHYYHYHTIIYSFYFIFTTTAYRFSFFF